MMATHSRKRVCLFTGAGGRLGETFCRLYRSAYDIVAVYRRRAPDVPSQLTTLVDPIAPRERLPENEHPVFAVKADLTLPGQVERVVELALARYGRIDLLVHAAADTAFLGSTLELDARMDRLRAQWDVNVGAPIALSATVARLFWRGRSEENRAHSRNIVHLSSVSGLRAFPGSRQCAYAASKAALGMAAAYMADDYAGIGVRSNVLAPARFPDVVPVECAAELVARLDADTCSGRTVVLDASGERWSGGREATSRGSARRAGARR